MEDSPGRVGRRPVIVGLLGLTGVAATAACSASAGQPTASPSATTASATTGAAVPATTSAPSSPAPATTGPDGILHTPGADVTSGPTTTNAVALTFHGQGDLTLAHRVLEVAAAHGAHLTIFAVGQWLAATPSIGREIVAAGHDLGNHTWSHPTLTHLGPSAAAAEISRGADAVRSSVGAPGLLFRPSGTPTSTATIRAAAAQSGYARCISYDVDPLDYTDPGAAAVTSRTLAAVRSGSIVSLHLGHAGTAEALPAILDGLAAAHLNPVTLTQLLAS
ncbi:MAG: polysaccharide deacetylase family protein [Lapillicoccus sp.]